MPVNEESKKNLKPFQKGDKRINRKGRITNFAQLRKLAVKVANDKLGDTETTRVEALLQVMSTSRNNADRMGFLAYAFGKPKDELDLTTGGEKLPAPETMKPSEIAERVAHLLSIKGKNGDSVS